MIFGGGPSYIAPVREDLLRANRSNRTVKVLRISGRTAFEMRVRILKRKYWHIKGRRTKGKAYLVVGFTVDKKCVLAVMTYDGYATRCCELDVVDPNVFWPIVDMLGDDFKPNRASAALMSA